MNTLLSAAKRSTSHIFGRNFFTRATLYDVSCKCPDGGGTDKKDVVGKVNIIKPLEYQWSTIRMHQNDRRQRLYEFGLYVGICLPKYVQKVQLQHNEELEILTAPEGVYQVISFLRMHHNCCFGHCNAATAIDVPSRAYRFEVIYNLTSLRFSEFIRVKTYTDEVTPLKSQYGNYKCCNIFEREIYDMFGIIFTHHPDLRRILTDYGFNGHPLRKDYPLLGYTEVRYDDEIKKIVYEPVEYAQQVRQYDLSTPWQYYGNFHEGFNNPPPPKKGK